MKRIAIVAHGLGDGGAERVASFLANQFHRHSFQVLFLCVYSQEKVYQLDAGICCRTIPWKDSKAGRLITRSILIHRITKEFGADLIISFIEREVLWTSLFNIPIIFTMRSAPEHIFKTKLDKRICKFLYGRADAIAFQTESAKRCFSKKIQDRSCVIANPVAIDLPYWKAEQHKKRIITACRLVEVKNLPMLLKGFALFYKDYPQYQLMICGDGELRRQLIELADELGIKNAVSFPGFRNDIHDLISESAIFAMTSDYEGLSNAMLEALAIGIPTVCTNCPPGGASEYIENGKNGFLVPVGNEKALAACFRTLAQDAELARRLSCAAVGIRGNLSEETIFKKWKDLAEDVLEKRQSRRHRSDK